MMKSTHNLLRFNILNVASKVHTRMIPCSLNKEMM